MFKIMNNKLQKYGDSDFGIGNSLVAPFSSRSFFELDNWVDSLFNDLWRQPSFLFERNWRPTDIEEGKDNYTINVELPGFSKSEVNVSVQNSTLKVSAKNKKSSYVRSFSIGNWQVDKANVELKNGILTVTVPKSEQQKEKSLEIKEISEEKF